jgi:trans-2-enoyl-CoA reductase
VHGDPETAVRVETIPLSTPGPGQVLIRMRLAPINPADLNVIEGTYGKLPTLPATVGNEGVGEVVACGSGVEGLRPGDPVRPRDGVGSWASWLVADAARCTRLPAGLPDDQAAQLAINPATAWAVLHEFGSLLGGSVLLNAPSSGVGVALIALCRQRGLPVLALARTADEQARLAALGVTAVLEGREAAKALRAACAGAPARLALNQVGGDSAATLTKVLAPQGALVTIGALARQPFTLPNGPLIFNELRCQGFWVSCWYERAEPAMVTRMLDELASLVRSGALHLPVAATYPLARLPEAIRHARTPGRGGKVLIDLRVQS